MELFHIIATNRSTKKRESVTGHMSRIDADHWKADRSWKRTHKYFKVARVKFQKTKA